MKNRQVFVDESGMRARLVLWLEMIAGLGAVVMAVFIVLALFGSLGL